MSQSLQLEHYLDSLESLPSELRRNLTLLTDLDERSQGLLLSVDDESRRYRSSVETLSAGSRRAALSHVDSLYVRLREFADDKVQLAIQTYELVDKHIRRLDADLARFQMELRERKDAVVTDESDTVGATARKRGGGQKASARKGHALAAGEEPAAPIKKRGRKSEQSAAAVCDAPTGVAAITQPSDVLDMPVDPNEPTYCLCHQVSYGEMIGCDNLDCPIEWFHFACVGLTSKPKGKWFCAKCNVDKKK